MPITDHTLEYRHFEGILEEGQEGAGPVMVWDEGVYLPTQEKGKGIWEEISDRAAAKTVMQHGLAVGRLTFRLSGHKLQGSVPLPRSPLKQARALNPSLKSRLWGAGGIPRGSLL